MSQQEENLEGEQDVHVDSVQYFANGRDFARATEARRPGGDRPEPTSTCAGFPVLRGEHVVASGAADSDSDDDTIAARRRRGGGCVAGGGATSDAVLRSVDCNNARVRRAGYDAACRIMDASVAKVVHETHEGVFAATSEYFVQSMALRRKWHTSGVASVTWDAPFGAEAVDSIPTAVVFAGAARWWCARRCGRGSTLGSSVWSVCELWLLCVRVFVCRPELGRPGGFMSNAGNALTKTLVRLVRVCVPARKPPTHRCWFRFVNSDFLNREVLGRSLSLGLLSLDFLLALCSGSMTGLFQCVFAGRVAEDVV